MQPTITIDSTIAEPFPPENRRRSCDSPPTLGFTLTRTCISNNDPVLTPTLAKLASPRPTQRRAILDWLPRRPPIPRPQPAALDISISQTCNCPHIVGTMLVISSLALDTATR